MAMQVLHNSCNMYMGDLTYMYALAFPSLSPHAAPMPISQITRAHVATITCRPCIGNS